VELNSAQYVFLNDLNTKFRAYCGGYGSGKTFIGCVDLLLFAGKHPGIDQGYFAPTYPMIKDIFYPTFEEAAELLGFDIEINLSDKVVTLTRAGQVYGRIICRSMENPSRIIGFKIARALADEIDTLPRRKAHIVWRKIISRMRVVIPGVVNSIGVTTTPEGFGFVYEMFAEKPTADYSMVQASTYENADYLPADYIQSLRDTYPDNLVKAYINGEFVNLTQGSVYSNYDRTLNGTDATWNGTEPVHIGMDFNVGKMSAVVHVIRDGLPYAVDEMTKLLDTPATIAEIKARFNGVQINVYPDASGNSRKSTNASQTDLSLLREAGFFVYNENANPFVKDRVNAVQAMLLNGNGQRSYKINAAKCPTLSDGLLRQAYNDHGEPDKTQGHDHANDAAGYFINFCYPIIKPVTRLDVRF
jgi:hypothetical protein